MKIGIQTLGKDGTGRTALWFQVPVLEEEIKEKLGKNYEQSGYEIIGYVLPFEIKKKTPIEVINVKATEVLNRNENFQKDLKRSFFPKKDKHTRILSQVN